MSDLPSVPKRLQVEESRFRSPVSESMIQKFGSTANYLLDHYPIPPGAVMPFAGDEATLPVGWLTCDGSAVDRTTYANLYAAIGTKWGAGDGLTTFNLPDLRGAFLRGVNTTNLGSSGRDPDASIRTASGSGGASGDAVGSYQPDDFRSHTHRYVGGGGADSGVGAIPAGFTTYANVGSTGGNETRPVNLSVLYVIKT